jgi:hypothetical protein
LSTVSAVIGAGAAGAAVPYDLLVCCSPPSSTCAPLTCSSASSITSFVYIYLGVTGMLLALNLKFVLFSKDKQKVIPRNQLMVVLYKNEMYLSNEAGRLKTC